MKKVIDETVNTYLYEGKNKMNQGRLYVIYHNDYINDNNSDFDKIINQLEKLVDELPDTFRMTDMVIKHNPLIVSEKTNLNKSVNSLLPNKHKLSHK